jgi:hypothetical protein
MRGYTTLLDWANTVNFEDKIGWRRTVTRALCQRPVFVSDFSFSVFAFQSHLEGRFGKRQSGAIHKSCHQRRISSHGFEHKSQQVARSWRQRYTDSGLRFV